MAGKIASIISNGGGTGRNQELERQPTLGFSMLKCVNRERNFFLEISVGLMAIDSRSPIAMDQGEQQSNKCQCPPVAETPCSPSEPLSLGHKNA